MVHRPYPRWWRGAHCPFYDADFLERVAVCRARSQSALARHEATRSSQHRGCTSLGFEDVVPPLSDEDEDDRDTAVGDDDVSAASPSVALDDDAPFADVVRRASSLVWVILNHDDGGRRILFSFFAFLRIDRRGRGGGRQSVLLIPRPPDAAASPTSRQRRVRAECRRG